MPQWIHNRAEHILVKNPDMAKSTAWAIATQQSHALGKSPKGYGTSEGKHEAKEKYTTPKDDKKTANPGNLESTKMASSRLEAFADELIKIASLRKLFPLAMKAERKASKIKKAFQTSQYSTAIEGPKTARQASSVPPFVMPQLLKQAFTQSQYGSTGGFVDFGQVSHQPGFRVPSLAAPIKKTSDFEEEKKKKAGAIIPTGLTPASRLASARQVGMPRITPRSGPSIADISKPKGFGMPMPGATKTI